MDSGFRKNKNAASKDDITKRFNNIMFLISIGLRSMQLITLLSGMINPVSKSNPNICLKPESLNAIKLENVPKTIGLESSKVSHEVSSHIRNLPEGWNASSYKMATAADNGFTLSSGQTWVDSYRTK